MKQYNKYTVIYPYGELEFSKYTLPYLYDYRIESINELLIYFIQKFKKYSKKLKDHKKLYKDAIKILIDINENKNEKINILYKMLEILKNIFPNNMKYATEIEELIRPVDLL